MTSQTVTIVEPAGNLAPVPVINTPACTARTCNFSGVGTADPNIGDTITYPWNFGDGTATSTSSTRRPTRTRLDGTYTVTLTDTDGWGKAASTTRVVTIAKPARTGADPVISAPVCLVAGVQLLRQRLVRPER